MVLSLIGVLAARAFQSIGAETLQVMENSMFSKPEKWNPWSREGWIPSRRSRLRPVLDPQPRNASEFSLVVRHQDGAHASSMRGDQEVVGADGLTALLECVANLSVMCSCLLPEREDVQIEPKRRQLPRVLLDQRGIRDPVAEFRIRDRGNAYLRGASGTSARTVTIGRLSIMWNGLINRVLMNSATSVCLRKIGTSVVGDWGVSFSG